MTDAATRLASDVKAGASRLGNQEGATYTIQHRTPSRRGQCEGPYKVQFDRVGALVIWCRDAAGQSAGSSGTSYHRRFVDTQETFIVEKPAGSTLEVRLERRNGRAVIVDVN